MIRGVKGLKARTVREITRGDLGADLSEDWHAEVVYEKGVVYDVDSVDNDGTAYVYTDPILNEMWWLYIGRDIEFVCGQTE